MNSRDDFIAWLKTKHLRSKTIENYLYYYDKWDLGEYNQTSVNEYLEKKYHNIIAVAFLKNYQQFLKIHVKEYCLTEQQLRDIKDVEFPKQKHNTDYKLKKVLSRDDVGDIASAMINERNKLMILITYYCGLRVQELLQIKPHDFQWRKFDKKKRQEPCELIVYGKGGRERTALVQPLLAARVYEWIEAERNEIIPENLPIFNIKANRWSKILSKRSIQVIKRHVNPHLLRHSYATLLRKQGMDILDIQILMGHKNISSTQIYTHINIGDLKSKHSAIFPAAPPETLEHTQSQDPQPSQLSQEK